MKIAERIIKWVFKRTGIIVGGSEPWDIEVKHPGFYSRVLRRGSLGLGESYMEGWWDCPNLDEFFACLFKSGMLWIAELSPITIALFLKSKLTNLAPKKRAFEIGEQHYDLGNSFFRVMLGRRMAYSCAYWRGLTGNAENLNAAQEQKFDLICRKLDLKPGQRILDIGCGWGSFAFFAAACYGVKVVGLTVSKEQTVYARELCHGFPVEIRLQDYRDLDLGEASFDHIVSIGMFEHVGPKNYRNFMKVVKKYLRPGGLFLLHTIGTPSNFFHSGDPWILKYIFPVGEIPSRRQINRGSRGLFEVRDWHKLGEHYDKTLMSWYSRFVRGWGRLREEYGPKVNGQFYRMWKYYLLACAGAFRTGNIELWQVVFSRPDKHENYQAVR